LKFGHQGNIIVQVEDVLSAILYRLKTGCQWRSLPIKEFFDVPYSWKSVYHHFQKWSKDGSWERLLTQLLSEHKSQLDMSCIQLDGTHTIAKRGGESVAYQRRKKHKTTNLLIITDANGIPIACSEPIAGNHNDGYQVTQHVERMLKALQRSNIDTRGLFLNADSGFDIEELRQLCYQQDITDNIDTNNRNGRKCNGIFDELLYKKRYVIERTNSWLDSFKALLVRFETNKLHWLALNILAFIVILVRKL
jgi:transposase